MTVVTTPSHWTEIYDTKSGRLLQCRPVGSVAGSFPHTPWWHCVFHDPYERINFWSHALPGAAFLLIAVAHFCFQTTIPFAIGLFSIFAAVTHGFSALTHVFPDDHTIEKLDHIGITATIIGTPVTALIAKEHGDLPPPLLWLSVWLLLSAFLKPVPRVIGFMSGGALMVYLFGLLVLDEIFLVELFLYFSGGLFFLRNDGHSRGVGLADHHFLHYFSTVASVLHIKYLLNLS
jgi:predicted membrane channel-forming protein YqfA (hemolysin III family)